MVRKLSARGAVIRLMTSGAGSAVVSTVLTGALAAGTAAFGANVLGEYGLAFFLGIPFCLGLFAALVYGYREPREFEACIGVGAAAVVLASLALVAVALEGLICIVMALPLTVALGGLGAAVGYRLQRHGQPRPSPRVLGAVFLLAPTLLGVDSLDRPTVPVRPVTTSVVVDAPPAVVWRHIVSVEPLPPPRDALFRLGIAYPTHATIDGEGVGAIRRCTFTTGDFVEPITVWRPGRRLEFSVRSQPAAMQELSPYRTVHAPHLHGFLESKRGRFDLVPLSRGRTLLRGTTWYRNNMLPERYWRLWSDAMVHRIHRRVLVHVAALAEAEQRDRLVEEGTRLWEDRTQLPRQER